MPELMLTPTVPAGFAAPPLVPKSKDDIEKYASVIREINNLANSEIGKQFLVPFISKLTANKNEPNGLVQANQGDFKPMPNDNPSSPFFNGDKPGKRVGPAGSATVQTVVQRIEVPKPVKLSGEWQYERFLGGLIGVQQKLGEDKTLKEAIEWITQNKAIIITMTPPLEINP